MTNEQLRAAFQGVRKLSGSDEIPIKDSLRFAYIRQDLEPKVEELDKHRMKLIRDHAATDEDGNIVSSPQGGFQMADPEAFNEEMDDLMEDEVEVDFSPQPLSKVEELAEEHDVGISGDNIVDMLEAGVLVEEDG